MNHHRKRNHSSPEHRRSIKNLLQEKNLANRRLVLNARLQKLAIDVRASASKEEWSKYFDKEKEFQVNDKDLKSVSLIPSVEMQREDEKFSVGPHSKIKDTLTLAHKDIDMNKNLHKIRKNIFEEHHGDNLNEPSAPIGIPPKIRPPKPVQLDRIRGLQAKLKQKMAVRFSSSFGADLDAIDAFKRKEQYEGWVGKGKKRTLKFAVEGNDLKLHGHTIATHTADGIEVSNAGFDTGLTYSALKELGINAKRLPNGRVQLHTTEVDGISGEKVMVPYNEVSDTPIRAKKKQAKPKNPNRTVTEQSKFRQDVEGKSEKGELPLSSTSIQPDDQRYINSVTGVNTEIPKESRATDAHHIFGVESNPKLKNNPNNGIMLTRKEHREVETLNKGLLRKQAMLRLASIRSRIATFKQDIRTSNDMPENALNLSADSIMDKFEEFHKNNPDISKINGTFDPLKGEFVDASSPAGAMRLQNIFGAKGSLALNSITDTRQGPVTDINHIRSQLREIEQEGGIPSVGIFDGSLEATKVLRDWSDKDVLNDLLESQRSTAIIDPDTRLRIVDNVSFRQN